MFDSIRFRAIFFTALVFASLLVSARMAQHFYTSWIINSAFEDQIQSRFFFLYSILQTSSETNANPITNNIAKAQPPGDVKDNINLGDQLRPEVLKGKIVTYQTTFFWGVLDKNGDLRVSQCLPGKLPENPFATVEDKAWWMGAIGDVQCRVFHGNLPSGEILFVGSPVTDVNSVIKYFFYMNFAVVLVVIFIIGFCIWIIFGQIFRPLQNISKIAEKIGSGMISTRIKTSEIDTELRPVAQSLNDMLDRLEQTIEAHARYNSEVSHEILTPLNSVTAIIEESIQLAKSGQDITSNLLECQSAVQKTTILAGDLLELARSESVSTHTHIWIDLEPVIDQAVVDAKRLASEKGIQFELQSSTVGVFANPSQIYQVVLNLVTNAIKFSPENSTIQITLIQSSKEAQFSVYDSGPGVCPSEIGNLFKRFFRTQSALSEQKVGYGLGLAICKNLIDHHKGKIGYERTAQGLTRFYFTLPIDSPSEGQ